MDSTKAAEAHHRHQRLPRRLTVSASAAYTAPTEGETRKKLNNQRHNASLVIKKKQYAKLLNAAPVSYRYGERQGWMGRMLKSAEEAGLQGS